MHRPSWARCQRGQLSGFKGEGFPEEVTQKLRGDSGALGGDGSDHMPDSHTAQGLENHVRGTEQLAWGWSEGLGGEGQKERPEGWLNGPQGQDMVLNLITWL